ncbi:cytochrome P450 [Tricholoma matsutake]|nr:cytochrome P450 [Tricholoma matsutake 945]
MFSLSSQTLSCSWSVLQDRPAVISTAAAILLAAVTLYLAIFRTKHKDTDVHELDGFSILTAWPFFNRRFDFLMSNFAKTGETLFSFKVLQHSVIAVRGEDARKTFFEDRNLDPNQGYTILKGAVPTALNLQVSTSPREDELRSHKYLIALFHKERVLEFLPVLFDDIQTRMDAWGREGVVDPFKRADDIIWQLTVRMTACDELAENSDVIRKLQANYWRLERSATPTALLLPWLPSIGKINKQIATISLYLTLRGYVEKRKLSDAPSSDAIDILLARGLDTKETITQILVAIFAGVINSAVNLSWLLLFLSSNKEWKDKVAAEVQAIIEQHTDTTSTDPLHKRLATVPISVWEEEMPMLELALRETLRLTVNSAALRRNLAEDLNVCDKKLPLGSFVTYSFSDAHLNPEIYTNPRQFDPGRFLPGREEDKKQAYGFLGWGGGRHPCVGMKIAKLEIKIIIALFFTGYEYDVVDAHGRPVNYLPNPNYNDIHQTRPYGEPCYIKFKRVVD